MGSMAWLSWRLRSGREVQVWEMERLGLKLSTLAAMLSLFSKASRAPDPHSRALQVNPPIHRPDSLSSHFFVRVIFGYSVFHEVNTQVASSGRLRELARDCFHPRRVALHQSWERRQQAGSLHTAIPLVLPIPSWHCV